MKLKEAIHVFGKIWERDKNIMGTDKFYITSEEEYQAYKKLTSVADEVLSKLFSREMKIRAWNSLDNLKIQIKER